MSVRAETEWMSSRELCDAVGISYRQLVHWVGIGAMRPANGEPRGTGNWWRWSRAEVARAERIKYHIDSLKTLGFTVGRPRGRHA